MAESDCVSCYSGFLSDPARFWDIDFLQSKKVMEVYTEVCCTDGNSRILN